MDYRIKSAGRDRKVAARRERMVVSGKSVFVIQEVIAKKARDAKKRREAR